MAWDILGEPYTARVIDLGGTAAQPEIAVLVRRPAEKRVRRAVLYVHGFCDYFFQCHVAEHFTNAGYDFYALDLRAYGRSLQPHQLPNFTRNLAEHSRELDAAADLIRQDGHDRLVLLAHSTGGLIVPLWAAARRHQLPLDALVLNSPWLDLAEPWFHRTIGTAAVDLIGAALPKLVIKPKLPPTYAHSLLASEHGEWTYNLAWKPVEHFPIRAGWLRSVRRAHALVHAGIEVGAPTLVLHSTRSLLHRKVWETAANSADTVLDVQHIARWAPQLGSDVTVVPIAHALHDVFLSAPAVRTEALSIAMDWLSNNTRF